MDGHIGIIWSQKQYFAGYIFFFLHAQIYLLLKQNTIFGLSVAILRHNDITW